MIWFGGVLLKIKMTTGDFVINATKYDLRLLWEKFHGFVDNVRVEQVIPLPPVNKGCLDHLDLLGWINLMLLWHEVVGLS